MSEDSRAVATTKKSAFNCPHCNAYAHQAWIKPDGTASQFHGEKINELVKMVGGFDTGGVSPALKIDPKTPQKPEIVNMVLSRCAHCTQMAIWVGEKMVFPSAKTVADPNPDMPTDVASVYREAASIFAKSPRASAALLRLAIQLLLVHLGEGGKNINADIRSLVKKGLDPRLQRAFDTLRLVGNDSVHPGEIDVNDNPQICEGLFKLINIVVEKMISEPKAIDELYELLPEEKKEHIRARDKDG